MSLANCVFALRTERPEDRAAVERRLAALAGVYGVLGPVEHVLDWAAGGQVAVGAIVPEGRRPAETPGVHAWGCAPPAPVDLLAAGDAELRRLDGPLGAVALGTNRAVAVAAGGGTTALYAAAGPLGRVWSSHALAAAWLAGLRPAVDAGAVPEHLAAEHPGGERTLLAGVRALAPGTRVEIDVDSSREADFWPASERWRPVPEGEAAGLAEAELLAGLGHRLGPGDQPVLGLTAGLDSRVALVAMRELGLPVRGFTYGDGDGPDARGAAAAARALGVDHDVAAFSWWPDQAGMARLRAEACWFDGARPAGFGDVPWPHMSHWMAGIGGETGRAFLYRWSRPDRTREPTPDALARAVAVHLGERLLGADRSVRRGLEARWREWIDDARRLGARGWRTLDVVYSEQRVRRWGRAMLPRVDAGAVPVFATPELQRALAWLPLDDRLGDGFARRLIAARAPELELPLSAPPRRAPIPALHARRARQALRSTRRSMHLPRPAPSADRWFTQPPWSERPLFVEWLTDAVLTSPLLDGAVGGTWLRSTREGFLRGDPAAAELSMWAAGVVALDEAVRDLVVL